MPAYAQFRLLPLWQAATTLFQVALALVRSIPRGKDYWFRYQFFSAAGFLADNIAEGFGCSGSKEFINCLSIAKGSSGEVSSASCQGANPGYASEDMARGAVRKCNRLATEFSGFMSYLCTCGYLVLNSKAVIASGT